MTQRRIARRTLLRRGITGLAGAGLLGLGGVEYARLVEPRWVEVHPVRLTLPRLAPAFHRYRVVQISDLHMGDWMNRARLLEVVQLVNEQQADLVAVTGDFVTQNAEASAQDLVDILRSLHAPDGVVAILGNHDHWSNPDVIRAVIRQSGMHDLDNAVLTLEREGALLHIAGVDDTWEQQDRLDTVVAALPAQGAAVLLAHEPDYADVSAATGRFDLQISGHSHGGQVILPFHGPLRLPPYGRRYPVGRYQVGTMIQYTNRGVGMLSPHVRVNCRPEITAFILEAKG
jgi:uncharacterized protein